MTNLSKAFDIVLLGNKFTYSLNGNDDINNPFPTQRWDYCDFSARRFQLGTRADFDANLRAFVIEHSNDLTDYDTGVMVHYMDNSKMYFFDLIRKKD